MPTIFSYRVLAPAVLSMLNNIYAIFLGLLFTYFISFRVDVNGEALPVKVMITPENLALVSVLSTYFILDWLTAAITVPLKKDLLYLLPIALILLIVYLGVMIIFALDTTKLNSLSWMFSIYATIVPFWDLCVYKLTSFGRSILILVLLVFRLAIGSVMLTATILVATFQPTGSVLLNKDFLILFTFLYLLLKFVRYVAYAAGS